MDDAFGLDPASDEFQAVKREMERLARLHADQVRHGVLVVVVTVRFISFCFVAWFLL